MATKKTDTPAKSAKKEDPPTRVFVGNPDLYPVPVKFVTSQKVDIASAQPLDIRSMPPIGNLQISTPFEINAEYMFVSFPNQAITQVKVLAVSGSWLYIRPLNPQTNPYGGAIYTPYWVNSSWFLHCTKTRNAKADSPTKGAAKRPAKKQ